MAQRLRTRGRPKGSGVNDHARLQEITRLIETNPEMKPTTAIRTIGVSDPSAIRRLREKLKVHRPDQRDVHVPSEPAPASSITPPGSNITPISAASARSGSVPVVARRPAAPDQSGGQLASSTAPHSTARDPAGLWIDFYSASVSAASVAIGVQMYALSSAFALSPFARLSWDFTGTKTRHDWLELDRGTILATAGLRTVH